MSYLLDNSNALLNRDIVDVAEGDFFNLKTNPGLVQLRQVEGRTVITDKSNGTRDIESFDGEIICYNKNLIDLDILVRYNPQRVTRAGDVLLYNYNHGLIYSIFLPKGTKIRCSWKNSIETPRNYSEIKYTDDSYYYEVPNGQSFVLEKDMKQIIIKLNDETHREFTISEIMLEILPIEEKQERPISYVPHLGAKSKTITLRSLPTGTKDTLEYQGDGKFLYTKRIEKAVFDGSELWDDYGSGEDGTHPCHLFGCDYKKGSFKYLKPALNRTGIISNKFKTYGEPGITDFTHKEMCMMEVIEDKPIVFFSIENSKITSDLGMQHKEWLRWLQSNPVTAYYEVAEPQREIMYLPTFVSFEEETNIIFNSKIRPKANIELCSFGALYNKLSNKLDVEQARPNPNLCANGDFRNMLNTNDTFIKEYANGKDGKFFANNWVVRNTDIKIEKKKTGYKFTYDGEEGTSNPTFGINYIFQNCEELFGKMVTITFKVTDIKGKYLHGMTQNANMYSFSKHMYDSSLYTADIEKPGVYSYSYVINEELAANYLYLVFGFYSDSKRNLQKGNYIELEYVKIEYGETATPIVDEPYSSKLVSCNLVKQFDGGIRVVPKADLNDYTTFGNYYCPVDVEAQALKNCPTKNAFIMEVYNAVGKQIEGTDMRYIKQKVEDLLNNVYIRNIFKGTNDTYNFGEWLLLYSSSPIPQSTE